MLPPIPLGAHKLSRQRLGTGAQIKVAQLLVYPVVEKPAPRSGIRGKRGAGAEDGGRTATAGYAIPEEARVR